MCQQDENATVSADSSVAHNLTCAKIGKISSYNLLIG